MHDRVRLLALVLLAVLAAPEVSFAQTNAQTAASWGLLGIWRLDCSKPMSKSNPNLSYVVRSGKLFHDRDFSDARDSSPVMSVIRKADGSLELLVNFTSLSQTRQFSFTKGSDGRIRAKSNRNVDTNEYTIKDGKFTATGNTPPWQSRCR